MNGDSKYHDEYYNYILEGIQPDNTAKKTVFDIIHDLTDRRGLRQEFEQFDTDIQDEIINKWISLVENATRIAI